MAVKIGDSVRFLNSVGGGRVTRIVDGLAYVEDEDGFETPVLIRECVVVGQVLNNAVSSELKSSDVKTPSKASVSPAVHTAATTPSPKTSAVVEAGNFNIVLGFEPTDIKALSRSTFDAYIVNDAPFCIFITIASRGSDERLWTPRCHAVIEAGMQEFVFELDQSALPSFDRLRIVCVPFTQDQLFEAVTPSVVEFKVDATKFAKLHCFRPNPYFDNAVIAFDIATNGRMASASEINPVAILEETANRKVEKQKAKIRRNISSEYTEAGPNGVIEIDLHVDALLDSVTGLSSADILNLQIDRFQQVMDANIGHPGRKIVFIHGKGEGVLRQALLKELSHRYKGHDVNDASFARYGFGATQVTITNAGNKPSNQLPRKNKRR